MASAPKDEQADDALDELFQQARIQELSPDEDEYEDVGENGLPTWLQSATLALFPDLHVTATSQAQEKVTRECLPHLTGEETQGLPLNSHGLPHLRRSQHSGFLRAQFDRLPAPYVAIDASRPWFFYWVLCGLSTLGEDVSHYRQRLVETVKPLQNSTGGFGGGHGQLSHCAASYATVLALATTEGLHVVDRQAMWHWLGSVKQADGGFCMAMGAEEDIRGAYCAMTIITLLHLPLELPPDAPARTAGLTSFLDGLAAWIGRCQTYEGGIGGAPTNEAHGAYAFCALACLSIIDAPHVSIPKHLDVPALIAWLATRQTQPEGGFQGRQEKLVDACYSHWVGGCWALIEAALSAAPLHNAAAGIWNREALVRYLLTCCQQPGKRGGMRDKPSTRPDAYHTCYSLAGLSHAENHYHYEDQTAVRSEGSSRLTAAFNWSAMAPTEKEMEEWKLDAADVVGFVHPVFVIPMAAVEKVKSDFDDGRFS